MQSLRATGGELERALAAEQKRLKDVQQTARRRQENDAEKAKELLAQIAASDADGAREKAERLRAEARTAEVVEELLAERATVEDHEKVIAAHLRTIEETRGIRTRERWAYTLGLHPGPTHWAYTLGLHPGPTPWAYTLGLHTGPILGRMAQGCVPECVGTLARRGGGVWFIPLLLSSRAHLRCMPRAHLRSMPRAHLRSMLLGGSISRGRCVTPPWERSHARRSSPLCTLSLCV